MKKKKLPSKKVILVGFANPIKLKSKKFVIETLYKRAKRNPFLKDKSYSEYVDFLLEQIESLGLESVDKNSDNLESVIYDKLKEMNWLRVINAFIVAVITTDIGV